MIPFPARFPLTFRESQGSWVELRSPSDQRVITQVQNATEDDVEYLLQRLPRAQERMRAMKDYERAETLRRVAGSILDHAEELAFLIATEGGKPLKDARVEVARARLTLELCAEESLRLGGESIPMGRAASGNQHLSFTRREPIGPVLAISAFNHPLNLLAHQVGTAIAAGCAVVVKPAPATPLSAFRLQEFFQRAGLPEEVLFVVNAEVPEIERLAASRHFAFVSFIGSAKVGWHLRSKLAPGTRLALEHGGQAPAIVRADAEIPAAVTALVKGAFYHAGQVCISTQRIFVHRSQKEGFLAAFLTGARALKLGEATLEATDVGPLIRPAEVTRIRGWIDEAIKAGAKLILGNEVSGPSSQFLSPTILSNVPRDCRLMTDEVFGPVVCINSYDDEAELLSYLNANSYVFEAAVFTKDITSALNWALELSSMTVVINDHNAYRVDWMPFGGHGLSGLGMGGVRYAVEEQTRLKQIIIKH